MDMRDVSMALAQRAKRTAFEEQPQHA